MSEHYLKTKNILMYVFLFLPFFQKINLYTSIKHYWKGCSAPITVKIAMRQISFKIFFHSSKSISERNNRCTRKSYIPYTRIRISKGKIILTTLTWTLIRFCTLPGRQQPRASRRWNPLISVEMTSFSGYSKSKLTNKERRL